MNEFPAAPMPFVDRQEPLDRANTLINTARSREEPLRLLVTGPQGIGKTMFAQYLAHGLLGRYGDRRLYAELGGSAPGGGTEPAEILADWLGAMRWENDRAGGEIPAGLSARQRLFRSLTVRGSVLMLLDDVHDGPQVEALLPSSSDAVVIATSRRDLDHLHRQGFRRIVLGELTDEHAIALLEALMPDGLAAGEPEAVRALAGLCGGLPLALAIASARVRRRGDRPLGVLTDLLRARSPLDVLHLDGERVIRLLLDTCADALTPPARRAYLTLGLHPGPDFAATTASALLGDADDVLDELCAAHLLRPSPPGDRYRFHHALIARHAHELAVAELSPEERLDTIKSITGGYAARAAALARVYSGRWWVSDVFARTAPAHHGPGARAAVRAELAAEQANLRAVVRLAGEAGLHADCVAVCEALWPLFYQTDRADALLEILPIGLEAAGHLGALASMRLHQDLGATAEQAAEHEAAAQGAGHETRRTALLHTALESFGEFRRLAGELDHVPGMQSAREWQGIVLGQLPGRIEEGIARLRESWEIVEDRMPDGAQRDRMCALLRLHLARLLTDAGRPDEAHPLVRAAHDWFTAQGEAINTGRSASTLGLALTLLGRPEEGRAAAEEAVALLTGENARSAAMRTMIAMAGVVPPAEARAWLDRAVPAATELGLLSLADRLRGQRDALPA
ncbi:NB-ARC domain-containing protein [Catenuloplanes japonicus]|uniref:hypothetical protein n=1 Tax=Catenuloplanes japonicus TaxID=33876 RepID=UPI000527CF94|nr:hypothetical protein [Catenuloplanes japonicus]